jgi:hypothetical protein
MAIGLLIVLACMEAGAVQVTVDFESVDIPSLTAVGDDTPGEEQILPGGVFDGMLFVENPVVGALHLVADGGCAVGCAASGSNSLLFEGFHRDGQPPLVIRHPAGLPFRLLALDVGEGFTTPRELMNAAGLKLQGKVSLDVLIEVTVSLDGIVDGPGGAADFQTATLPTEFSEVFFEKVALFGVYTPDGDWAAFQLDNLVFDVQGEHVSYTALNVPEPAAWALVLLAIGMVVVKDARNVRRARGRFLAADAG